MRSDKAEAEEGSDWTYTLCGYPNPFQGMAFGYRERPGLKDVVPVI